MFTKWQAMVNKLLNYPTEALTHMVVIVGMAHGNG